MENHVCHPLAHSRLRYSRSETLQPTPPEESLKCYCLKVRKITPGSHALHDMVNETFQHTFTHILGPLVSFGVIPVLRGPLPHQNSYLWAPGGLAPSISPRKVPPMYFFIG